MTYELTAPVDALWKVLPAVYDSLGIEITRRDPASHTLGNDGLRLRRRLGKVPLQRYLDCGSSQGGPNAESYDVHLTVRTRLQPGAAGHSRLSTTVQAQARPINFAGDWVRCTSKNQLEQRIAELGTALVR